MRKLACLFVIALLMCSLGWSQTINFANFNAGLPAGWTIVNGGSTPDTWVVTTNLFNGNSLNGSNFAFVNSDAVGATPARTFNEQLRSPIFNGNSYGQVYLEFDQYYRDYSLDTGFVEVFNGTAWVAVASYSANSGAWNAPAHITLNLTPYRNANMQIRFRYEDDGIWAWYWAVDNVNIYAPSPYNATLTALVPDSGTCGQTAAEPVAITIRNDGSAVITSLPVSYQINGGAVITETITTPIAPNATFNYVFTTGANMSAAGVYTFKAWTSLPGDASTTGDTISNVQRKNHIRISSFPYVEDFENNNGGWFPVGTNHTWAWGTPNKTVIQGASSGVKVWTTGGLTGDYLNNDHSELEGPCFDLSALSGAWFGTDIWWNAEHSWDGASLQASVDGGATWANVGALNDPYNWYNDNSINGNPGGQQVGWTGRNSSGNGSGGWVRAAHSIAYLSGNAEVLLRLAFGTDGSVVDDGIAFDKITIARQPVFYLGADTAVCDSFVLNAGNWSEYEWSTGDTTASILITQSGTYAASIIDNYGFPSADVIYVDIQSAGNWDLGNDIYSCSSAPINLAGPVGASQFQWNTGSTTSSISASTSGTYALTASYPAGCVYSDTIDIQFSALQAVIDPAIDTLCRGTILQFTNQAVGASTYWWDFGNGSFSNLPNPNTVYLGGGTYQIMLTVGDSICQDTAVRQVFVDICTGLDEMKLASIKLYPNPSQGQSTLALTSWPVGEYALMVMDAAGRQMLKRDIQINAAHQEISLDEAVMWPAGVYQVIISGHEVVKTANWVIRQ